MMKAKPFSDIEYGRVLDHIVVACVDTAITNGGKILLVKRSVNPAKGSWWIFGGRLAKGENLHAAARRSLVRELSFNIEEERFNEVGIFNLIWPVRREPITTNGCHHLLVAHQVEITNIEKECLDNFIEGDSRYIWIDLNNTKDVDLLPELKAILLKLRITSPGKLLKL
jgi:colanic acid biosynthesis protein WcaH